MTGAGSTFVYRPGGVTAGNVFADWPTLYAALAATPGPKFVQIDDSIVSPAVVPAGTYDLSGVTFSGVPNFNSDSGNAVLDFAAGVTITAPTTIVFFWMDVHFLGTTPCITAAAGQEVNLYFQGPAILQTSTTGAFLDVTAGFGFVILTSTAVAGDGTNPALIGADIQAYNSSELTVNATSGCTLYPDDTMTIDEPQPGLTIELQADAPLVAYAPAVPANWAGTPPATVAAALDRIAANTTNAHPIP